MENKIMCLYYSEGGTSFEYAAYLYDEYNIEMTEITKTKFKYLDFDLLIYIAPVFNGKIHKLNTLIKNYDSFKNSEVLILPVGISEESEELEKKLYDDNLAGTVLENSKLLYMRGQIDISKLGFVHRNMLKMVYNSLVKKENRTKEEDELIYNVYYGTYYCSNYYLERPLEIIKKHL